MMLSKKELCDGASRKLLYSVCKTIIDDPRIGPTLDAIPEQDHTSLLARLRDIMHGPEIHRLTRI